MLYHCMWVTVCGSLYVGHCMWVTICGSLYCGSLYVGHCMCVIVCVSLYVGHCMLQCTQCQDISVDDVGKNNFITKGVEKSVS